MSDNLSLKDKRELYKAMRSAHDGICPLCGEGILHNPSIFAKYECDSCDFNLTNEEIIQIRAWRGLFHPDLKQVMRRWRYYNER